MLPGIIGIGGFIGSSVSVTDLGPFSASWSATTNITSVDFGAAASTRRMFMIVHWYGTAGGTRVISSATIGGVSATVHAQDGDRNSGTGDSYGIAIISAVVPTNTSGTVSLTFDASGTGTVVIHSIRAVGLVGSIVDAQNNHNGPGTSTSVNVNVPAQGVIIVGSTGMLALSNITLTGGADYSVNDSGSRYAGKTSTGEAANASKTLTASFSGGSASIGIAAITWRGG